MRIRFASHVLIASLKELVVENLEKGLQNLARAVQEYECKAHDTYTPRKNLSSSIATVPEAKLSGGPQLSTQQLRVYEELYVVKKHMSAQTLTVLPL